MKYTRKYRIAFLIAVTIFSLSSFSLAQWGEIKGEQVEDVFLRNDEACTIESDDATITVKTLNGSSGDSMLILQNGSDTVFRSGIPGFLVLDSTAAVRFGSTSDRAVAAVEDSLEHVKPLIYFGSCSDGTVAYTSDSYRTSFASGCVPFVTLTLASGATQSGVDYYFYWIKIISSSNTGFQYKVYRWSFDGPDITSINVDVTTSITVYWQAMGWVD